MTATTWSVIVPVKSAAHAKTRLAAEYGPWRPYLARAFAMDTIRAADDCARTSSIVVVTDDEEVGGLLAGRERVAVVADGGSGDVNAAIRIGLGSVPAANSAAVITSDLPALTGRGLAVALDLAAAVDSGVVADKEGAGTTMLTTRTPGSLRPRFGPESLRLHIADGAVELEVGDSAAIRRDVDLPAHLRAAVALGVGPSTTDLIERIRRGTGSESDPVPRRKPDSDVSASWQLPSS